MKEVLSLTGNDAVAYAFKHAKPDVVVAFPITPQTELMHKFAEFVADGEVDTELVLVESEHSAMSAAVGAAAAGARVATATSSQGFALMWEIVYIAASLRLPIVMAVINRALSGPINIHCDHSDAMGGRDSGWIQLFSENSQQAYDNAIQAFKIASNPDVFLPVMINLDGFILSHTAEPVELLDEKTAQEFIGPHQSPYSLFDFKNPITVGPLDLPDYYFEHKRAEIEAMSRAPKIIEEVGKAYGKLTGREYGFFEKYMMDDAELVFVALGSTSGTVKFAIDRMRERGLKVGLLSIRMFRPFPYSKIRECLKNCPMIAVLDRSVSFGAECGPLCLEIKSALYGVENPPKIGNLIYGLGGRDITYFQIEELSERLLKERSIEPFGYIGLRE